MRITVSNAQEHLELLQRMAAKGFTKPYYVQLQGKGDQRSNDQNSLLWAALTEVSKQVEWNGQHLSPTDWKTLFTASMKQQRAVPGLSGGIVFLGSSTSQMNKTDLSDLLETIFSFGAENGVKFKETRYEL